MSLASREFFDGVGRFYSDHCIYMPAMLGWFLFSAILSSYNKYVFGDGHMNFPCPLLLTSVHFLIQWIFSYVACACFPEKLGADRVTNMTWKEWASVSVPCGIVTALDIGFSNLALVTITLTFYTMVKASTPIFVLSWAYIFKIERITWPLIGVVIVIAMGEFLTVFGEVDFVFHGFALCLLASVLSGARWTLVQLKLQNLDPPLKSTLVTMKLLTPSMVWSMVFLSIVIEKPWVKLVEAQDNDSNELLKVFLLGMIGGTFAIVMILCELYLILKASAIILMIGGVIKELTTIFVGVSFFGDRLNLMNTAGVCVVFSGVMLYKVVFHLQKKENERSGMEPIQSEDVFDEDEQDFANESDEEFLDEDQETFVDEVPGVSNLNCESELLDEEVKLEMATRYS